MIFSLKVMMYHYVRDPGDAAEAGSGIPGLPVGQFEAQLDALTREYEVVTWDRVRDAVLERKSLPARACLLTFDDGLCDHYLNVYPALQRRDLSGLFFPLARDEMMGLALGHKLHFLLALIGCDALREMLWARLDEPQRARFQNAEARYRLRWHSELEVFKGVLQRDLADEVDPILSELIEEQIGSEKQLARQLYLNPERIREMHAGGMRFGGHSRTHPWLDFLNYTRRAVEIRASREWLSTVEEPPFAFAYPYSGLAEDMPTLLATNGFVAAFTTEARLSHSDAFSIGRYDGEEWYE